MMIQRFSLLYELEYKFMNQMESQLVFDWFVTNFLSCILLWGFFFTADIIAKASFSIWLYLFF